MGYYGNLGNHNDYYRRENYGTHKIDISWSKSIFLFN